ncbi:hypothetical protein GRF56_16760 [Aeromonas veronii]|uniref:hypothetical protein n=1 Tax=Aeromonas veronii TaxID=654 RepID=UPI001317649E|nr:hypothetical protein [Aeromonas veronii]QHC08929.1 hypothetical protein GRF56_16760 [Aeromonas veronii]
MTEQATIEKTKADTAQTQLVVIEPTTAVALFTEGQGIAELLADIRQKATSLVPDITTTKGRKEIASVAYAVAKTKTYLEGFGKELTDKYKEIPKRIDANRKVLRDTLDALKDEVRAPLTQYEAAEEARVAALKERMTAFADAKQATAELPSTELEHYLQQIDAIAIDDSWEEMTAQAGVAKDAAVLHLRTVIEKAKEREAQAAELERLRQEAAAREQADRERRIAEQAAETARQEEARRQQNKRDESERREREAKEREQQAIRDAEAAELARQQAEARRIAEAEQAEQRRLQAEENARRQAEEAAARAAEQERLRIENEQRLKAEEDARRAADRAHRGRINSAIVMDLMGMGLSEDFATNLVRHIASNKIEHLSINY